MGDLHQHDGRRLAAIMFMDMVGYSARMQQNEPRAIAAVHSLWALVRPILSRHGGREVDLAGDGMLMEFGGVLDAIRCSLDVHEALARQNEGVAEAEQVRVRGGVHLGDIEHRNGRVYGDGVNIAARVIALSPSGAVTMTSHVRDQLLNVLDRQPTRLGLRRLKNIKAPMEIWCLPGPQCTPAEIRAAQRDDETAARRWTFGACVLDERTLELKVGGKPVSLDKPSLDCLMFLLNHAGEVLTEEELVSAVAPGRPAVMQESLARVREALAAAGEEVIKPVHGFGYRLAVAARVETFAADAAPHFDFAPGTRPRQRPSWSLVERLGAGGHGEAWLARHDKTRETRVFKFALEASALASLKREITLSRVLRDGLGDRTEFVRVLDWNLEELPYFIETEYSNSGNLGQWLEAQGGVARVPLATRVRLVAQVADALAAAHSVGVLHKDLKPSNILVHVEPGKEPRIRIADFGSGGVLDAERLERMGITRMGFTKLAIDTGGTTSGTPLYLAPEVLGGQPFTAHADVYALGVILYQLAVGDLKRSLAPGWETEIEDACLRDDIAAAAAGNPARRLASADLLAERLRQLDARRAELRAAQRAKARRRIATAAALAAVAVAVPAGIWAWQESVKREIALHDHIANLKSLGRSALEADEPGTAAAYLGEAYRLGETSLSLRYQLAKAMRGVDPLERVLRQVPAHGGPWTIARFSADGKRVITCSVSNNKIAIWDVASGGKVREIDTGAWVGLAGFSPDGNRVYSTTNDNVKLWDAATGAPLKTLSGLARPGAMLSPRFASDWSRIFIRNIDGSVHLYRAPEYDEAWKAGGPEAKVGTSIGMSPSGRFAVGAIGDRIHAWWLQQPPRDTSAAAPAEGVKQVLAAPDDASFAVLGNDGSVRLWDAATLRPSATYPGRAPVSLSSFSRDGRVLVMEGNDNQQEFWRVPLAAATSAPYAGATASFTPDGHWFAHGRLDTVRVVSAVTGKPRLTLAGHSAEVLDAVFDPAGERLLSFGRDGTARLWRMPAADDAPVIRVPHSGYVIVSDLLYSADGRRLIALMSDGRKLTADAATGEVIRSVQGPATDVRTAGLPVDENDRVIFVFSDNHYELWDMAAGRRVATLAARGMHSEATLDRHGRYAVSMTPVAAEVVDAAAGARLLSVPGFHAEGRPDDVIETWVQFTDDGGRVAIADGRNPVRIVALPRGEVVDTLPDWTAGTVTLSWGPGDQTLGLVDGQGLLSVWDLARKAVAHTLQSQNGQIWLMRAAGRAAEHATQGHLLWNLESGTSRFLGGVVWPGWKESGDGSRLATVGGDARLRLWDTAAGEVLDTFATGASWISDEAFTPDGRRLAVSDNLAVINQWPLGQPEARSAVEVQAVLRCKLPWKIDGDVALPVTEEPAGCP